MNEVTLHRGRHPHLTVVDAYFDNQHLTEAVVHHSIRFLCKADVVRRTDYCCQLQLDQQRIRCRLVDRSHIPRRTLSC